MSFFKKLVRNVGATTGLMESSEQKEAGRHRDAAAARSAAAEARAVEEYDFYRQNVRPRYEQELDKAFSPEEENRQQSLARGDYARGEAISQEGTTRRMEAYGVNPADRQVRTSSDQARSAMGLSTVSGQARRRVQSNRQGLMAAGMGMGPQAIGQQFQGAGQAGQFSQMEMNQANDLNTRRTNAVNWGRDQTAQGVQGFLGGFGQGVGGAIGSGAMFVEGGVVGEDAYWEDQENQFFGGAAAPAATPVAPGYQGGGAVRYNRGGPVRRLITPEESLYNDASYWASLDDAVQGEGYAEGGPIEGPGTGTSDSVPATIEGAEPARLSDGEFVVPADVVEYLGQKYFYDQIDKARKEIAGGGGAEGGKMMAQQQSGGGGGARRQAA